MKVLIIKTGLTETFDDANLHPGVVSLGDVLRSTVLLHLFPQDQIDWLTSSQALPLLDGLKQIQQIYLSSAQVRWGDYDLIVNLEREAELLIGLVAYENRVIGHVLSGGEHKFKIAAKLTRLKTWLSDPAVYSLNWCQKLFEMFGKNWNGENYLLAEKNLKAANANTFDIGLNWQVGVKWPTKMWPIESWTELSNKASVSWSVTWQEGFNDLIQYLNWINSARVIVTHDSLGLHIAKALDKPVIGLFGPTSSKEIFLPNGMALSVSEQASFACPPCYKAECHHIIHCMKSLSVDEVYRGLRNLLRGTHEQLTT